MDIGSGSYIQASHMLWIRIKLLHSIIEYAGSNFELSDSNDNNSEFWKLINSKVEDIFNCILDGNAIIAIINYSKKDNYEVQNQDEIWNRYIFLIENLQKLLLTKDYNIIQNYEDFINSLSDVMDFFEEKLGELLYNFGRRFIK